MNVSFFKLDEMFFTLADDCKFCSGFVHNVRTGNENQKRMHTPTYSLVVRNILLISTYLLLGGGVCFFGPTHAQ